MRYQAILLQCFPRQLRRDAGATAVEYAFMVAFIALVIVAAVSALGVHLSGIFADADAGLP